VNAKELRFRAIGGLGGSLIETVLHTVRFESQGDDAYRAERDAGRPVIFTLWHGRLLPLTWFHRSRNIVALISASADGEYITRVVQRWGYQVVRGSTSRGGGSALRELIRLLRQGRTIAITPDGPRGPRQKLKPGVLAAAQLSGFPLLPVSAGAGSAWWFEGWDRFLVPRPFTTVRVRYGPLVHVPRDASHERLQEIARSVENTLNQLTTSADEASAG
jgi:lysophospholipid acyltransferase (LPLAT)-like uncharacterized protein